MRDVLVWTVFAAALIVNLFVIVVNVRPVDAHFGPNGELWSAHDFRLRMNEARCLRQGVDPYDVWTQKTVKAPFYPFVRKDLASEEFDAPLNAYTPWEYTLALPLSFLPMNVSWRIYHALMLCAFGLICLLAYVFGRRLRGDCLDGLLFAVCPLLCVIPVSYDLNVGNYPILIAAAAMLMVVALQKGHDVWAGLCLAFMMTKPQVGVLFVIPLMLRRRVTVCAVGALTCVLLAIPPSLLCGKSLVELVLESPQACAFGFEGCALLPREVFNFLSRSFAVPKALWMSAPMLLGVVLCAVWSVRVRKDDWLTALAPAALCSVSWTYVLGYSYVMCVPTMLVLVGMAIRRGNWRFGLLCAAAVLLMARAGRAFEIVVNALVPPLSGFASVVCSWSATAALVLTLACFAMERKRT